MTRCVMFIDYYIAYYVMFDFLLLHSFVLCFILKKPPSFAFAYWEKMGNAFDQGLVVNGLCGNCPCARLQNLQLQFYQLDLSTFQTEYLIYFLPVTYPC
jgi:hypothetical protein